MRAKVRNYKLAATSYDTRKGAFLEKERIPGELTIVFDEDMYIHYPSNFEKDIHAILDDSKRKIIAPDTLMNLEFQINKLLKEYREMKFLFLESDLFFKQKEGMTILYKDSYFDAY